MSGRLRRTDGYWRVHAAATAVSLAVVVWMLAGRAGWDRGWWVVVPGLVHLVWALGSKAYAERSGRVVTRVGEGIGAVVSAVLLVGIYVLVVVPTGMVLRVLGRDPLARRHGGETSNWHRAAGFTPTDRMY